MEKNFATENFKAFSFVPSAKGLRKIFEIGSNYSESEKNSSAANEDKNVKCFVK
jgi:hypothetical protein